MLDPQAFAITRLCGNGFAVIGLDILIGQLEDPPLHKIVARRLDVLIIKEIGKEFRGHL